MSEEKKKIKEKRTEVISVCLTPTEKQDVKRLSKKYGLKMSSYLRFKGISDFVISSKTKGIKRIKKPSTKADIIINEMKTGFTHVIQELKQGFKDQKQFLKPIPEKDLKKIEIQKQERKKGILKI